MRCWPQMLPKAFPGLEAFGSSFSRTRACECTQYIVSSHPHAFMRPADNACHPPAENPAVASSHLHPGVPPSAGLLLANSILRASSELPAGLCSARAGAELVSCSSLSGVLSPRGRCWESTRQEGPPPGPVLSSAGLLALSEGDLRGP